jgi:hypothetical protein
MSLEVYHQLGHHAKWNLDSIVQDSAGDGVILPARFLNASKVSRLNTKIKEAAIFDPQFYEPAIPKGELATYDFFPGNIADGFDTDEYDEVAFESASRCVLFQNRNRFRYVTIPTRYLSGMPSTFTAKQDKLFISDFLEVIEQEGVLRPVLLQLILNEDMIKDKEYSVDLLNWITGMDRINGVYLIVARQARSKQIKDFQFLLAYLEFVYSLYENGLDVVLGYLNTEAVLLSIAHPHIVTMGSYETNRIFNIEKFRSLEPEEQRGPNPRLYVSKLLQWVEKPYVDALRALDSTLPNLFDENDYQALMFEPKAKWYFNNPVLYRHAFVALYKQLKGIGLLGGRERYRAVDTMMKESYSRYQALKQDVFFDAESDETHLTVWMNVASNFAKQRGWR